MGKLKELLYHTRELIWPVLETLEETEENLVRVEDCSWAVEERDIILDYASKYYESEESRKREVESKATIFIGTFGVVATILIYLAKDLVISDTNSQTWFLLILIFIMTLSIVYMSRAIWFSIKTLQRQSYYRISFPNSFLKSDNQNIKDRLIVKYYNDTRRNSNVINLKVDYMTMAQEYFKRVIFLVCLFAVLVFMRYVATFKDSFSEFHLFLNHIVDSNYFPFVMLSGIILLYVLILIIFNKLSKLIE
jgi:hypothetical protein